jgi:hypothetical protein
LACVLDHFGGDVDDAGDGALEVAVVAAEDVILVAVGCRRRGRFGGVGGCMRPDTGELAGGETSRLPSPRL